MIYPAMQDQLYGRDPNNVIRIIQNKPEQLDTGNKDRHERAAGLFSEPGVIPPERFGRDTACTEFILSGLRERGIVYRKSVEPLGTPASA
jgi:hypothetical protein